LTIYGILAVTANAYYDVKVYVDGNEVACDVEARLINCTTYIPLRSIANALGGEVEWNNVTRSAEVKAQGVSMTVMNYGSSICANGRYLYIENGVKNIGDRIMVPVRSISKVFGAKVEWIGETRKVMITSGGSPILPADEFYDKDELYWLSRIISAESAGEPLEGQIAVGNVVLNRVSSGEYPGSIYGVIFDRNYGVQFEPVLNGTVYNSPSDSSVIAAKICLEGTNVIEDSLYFFNPQTAQSFWIERNRTYIRTIGNHVFYR
jgi:N-acetylmuramoyl-L-alanine amidase